MQWLNSPQRYGAIARSFHWGMLALLAAICVAIELKGVFPRGAAGRAALLHWHELLGLTAALAVFACRPAPPSMPSRMRCPDPR